MHPQRNTPSLHALANTSKQVVNGNVWHKAMNIYLSDLRASFDAKHFGASLEDGSVTIWRSDSQFPITTVQPGFSGGEHRHFIDPVNRVIYSGTWLDGLTCFDYAENRIVWHRKDLIGIQTVDLSIGFPASVFVTLNAPDYKLNEPGVISGIVELAARDGSTKWTTEDGDWVHVDPRQPLLVIQDRYNRVVRILDATKKEVGSAPMINFAVIDVGFSKDMIALAEGVKGVRVLDHRGSVISRYLPRNRKPNCIRVAFHEDHLIVFDSWKGSFVTIVDPDTGKLVAEYEREFHDTICFIDNGSRFVDKSGQIFRSTNGQLETTLKAKQADADNRPLSLTLGQKS